MGTGFALVLWFCGTLGYRFVGSAGFGGGTGNSVRFGDRNGGCDGRSGKGGGGLESERFRFGFGFRHLGRFDFAINNIVQVVIAADDEQRLAKRVSEEIINGVRIRSFFMNGFVAVVVAVRVNGGGAVADIEFAGDVVAAELDIIHEGGRAFIGQGRVDGVIGKGFKLAAGDGAGLGQLSEFDQGIDGGFGLMEGKGVKHFRLDFRVANGFNVFIREGRYDNCAVGNGVGNDAGGGQVCDGFQNGEVTVSGCGFIIDAERGCFGVGEVIGRLNAQVYKVRGVLFDCGATLVKNVHCGVGEAVEAFDRPEFIVQPGAGTLAGLTGGRTGIEIADGGGQVKGIGEDEGIKRVNHLGDFLSFLQFHVVMGV